MNQLTSIKSASIILQRSTGEVYLVKRSDDVSFFPDFWVFPGGKIEEPLPDDWTGEEFDVYETIFKELYEEVGIVAGSDRTVEPSDRSDPFLVQNYDDDKRREFKDRMEYVGKKTTPPFRRKIYTAVYFHLHGDLVDEMEPIVDGEELIEGQWIHPQQAVEDWYDGVKKIPPPILQLLRNLDHEYFASITLNETFLPIGLQTKIEFAPGYQMIPITSDTIDPFFNTNLVVIGETDMLIVDPGANKEGKEHLRQMLLSLPSTPKVVLTHHHRDHWDGLEVVEDIYPDTEVCAHKLTLDRVTTDLQTTIIEDGDHIEVGNHLLQVVHTPGHTDGHISLYDANHKVLIAGDHVVGYGSAVLDPTCGSMIDYFTSTKKLLDLEISMVFPAHGPPNFNAKGLLQGYLEHRKEREDAILRSIEDGSSTLDEIVEDVYQDVPRKMWEYAKRNIQLHIEKLEVENRLPSGFSIDRNF